MNPTTTPTNPAVNPEVLPAIDGEFQIIPQDVELAPQARVSIESAFSPFFAKARELVAQAESVTSPKIARAVRLELKAVRNAAEKARKSLQEDARLYVNAVNGANNILLAALVPAEKRMDDIEKAEEMRIAAEIEERRQERRELLASYGVAPLVLDSPGLGTIPASEFQTLLDEGKFQHEARLERERAEAARVLAQQVEEAKERERVRLDNERLLREAQEREEAARVKAARVKAARVKAEREANEARHAQELAEAARLAQQEKDAAAEALRLKDIADAKALKEKKALQAKLDAEKTEREKLEHEAADLRAAEEKRRLDEEALETARLEAVERAAQAPDKVKLIAYADAILAIPVPTAKSKKVRAMIDATVADIRDVTETLKAQAEKL